MGDIDETQTPEADTDEEQDAEESEFVAPELDPDEQHDPEAAHEPPPPVDRSEQEIEAMFRKVERAAKLYTGKLEDAFGDDFKQYAECPLCAGDFPGYIHLAKVGGFPREIIAQANQIMTGFKQVEYKQLPGFQTCPTCGGEGKGFTGSKVPGKDIADCLDCGALGYLPPPMAQANGRAPEVRHADEPRGEEPFTSTDDVDPWGEPKTLPDGRPNPNHGKLPSHKQLIEPWGITANLTAREAV